MSALPLLGPKRRIPKWSRLALGAVLSVLLLASLFGQQPLPQPSGFINDYAGVLDQRIRASLEALAQDLQAKTRAEVAVAVLQTLGGESLEDYANRVAEHWGVGDEADRGVLLLLAIEERRLRIEVGYGLEGVIPDGVAGEIRDGMTPYLRQGNYNGAVAFGVSAVATIVARDSGVTLSGQPARSSGRQRSRGRGSWLPLLILAPLLLTRRRRVGGAWRGGADDYRLDARRNVRGNGGRICWKKSRGRRLRRLRGRWLRGRRRLRRGGRPRDAGYATIARRTRSAPFRRPR